MRVHVAARFTTPRAPIIYDRMGHVKSKSGERDTKPGPMCPPIKKETPLHNEQSTRFHIYHICYVHALILHKSGCVGTFLWVAGHQRHQDLIGRVCLYVYPSVTNPIFVHLCLDECVSLLSSAPNSHDRIYIFLFHFLLENQ
jgi:hypothetical protein